MHEPRWDNSTTDLWTRNRTIDLITRGRRSGRAHRTEIWWFSFEGRFVITGTPGPRDWYANVLADPHIVVEVAGRTTEARAEPVADHAFRRRFFTARDTAWYSSMADLDRLVAESPMVTVEPR